MGGLKFMTGLRPLFEKKNFIVNLYFNQTAIRPTLLYGTECWVIKRHHAQKMSVAEIRMLRWMCGNTRRDKARNEDIRTKIV